MILRRVLLSRQLDLTTDYNERVSLTGVRMVFALLATLIGAGATEIFVGVFSSKEGVEKSLQGYASMAAIYGVLILFSGTVAFFSTKSRDRTIKRKTGIKLSHYLSTFKNVPFVLLPASFFLLSIATTGVSSIFVYYISYNLGLSALMSSLILGVLIVAAIVAIPIWIKLSARWEKTGGTVLRYLVLFSEIRHGPGISAKRNRTFHDRIQIAANRRTVCTANHAGVVGSCHAVGLYPEWNYYPRSAAACVLPHQLGGAPQTVGQARAQSR